MAKTMVTVKDLALEYGVEGKDIRALLRANGMKAPEITREPGTFGPKAKYEWDADSKELKKIRGLIETTLNEEESTDAAEEEVDEAEEAPAKKPAKVKKAKK